MPKRITFIGVMILVVLSSYLAFAEEELKQVCSNFPPFTIAEDSDSPGFSYEIVREIHRYSGIHFNPDFLPWGRAQKYAQQRDNYLIFSIARTKKREPKYLWICNLISIDFGFVMAPEIAIVDSLDDAKKLKNIGVANHTPQLRMLKELGFTNITPVTDEKQNALMLMSRRIDAWYGPIPRSLYILKHIKLKEAPQISKPFETVDSYLAGSLNLSSDIVIKLKKAYDRVKSDGTYDRIYKKYFGF